MAARGTTPPAGILTAHEPLPRSVGSVKKVVILDYGSGNLRSAERALARVGADVTVTADAQAALDADGLVVPGVGAFAACMEGLRAVDGPKIIGRRLAGGRPVLGICVGMQILFERGLEHGQDAEGCGEWPGVVEQLTAPVLPHMGWNTVDSPAGTVLFDGLADQRFYFVHSYGVRDFPLAADGPPSPLAKPKVTWAEHGDRFVAGVENGPLSATQFHPEKSGDAGAHLLTNWLNTL
jgi:glutamine amidotransferase